MRLRRSSFSLAIGAAALAVGLCTFGSAWTCAVRKDPYSTLIDAIPARTDHPYLVALVRGSLVLTILGLITVVIGIALRGRRSG